MNLEKFMPGDLVLIRSHGLLLGTVAFLYTDDSKVPHGMLFVNLMNVKPEDDDINPIVYPGGMIRPDKPHIRVTPKQYVNLALKLEDPESYFN